MVNRRQVGNTIAGFLALAITILAVLGIYTLGDYIINHMYWQYVILFINKYLYPFLVGLITVIVVASVALAIYAYFWEVEK